MRRKTTPRVKGGVVQKKNNWRPSTGDYYQLDQSDLILDRKRPGEGYRHLLRSEDVRRFVELLPDWDELAQGLNAIVLAPGEDAMGWHEPGVVAICAWEEELWWESAEPSFIDDHAELLDRLGVERAGRKEHVVLRWTEPQARAFQLLHILVHELGHHYDRVTTRSQREASRGEPYAEAYATAHDMAIWEIYLSEFGLD